MIRPQGAPGTLVLAAPAIPGGGEACLQRLFSAFPAGFPGAGLLLLRLAAGATVLADGARCCAGPDALGHWTTLVAVGAGIAALATIAGAFTPASSTVLASIDLARLLSVVPAGEWQLLDGRPEILLRAAVAVALVMLGPGAHSIDAYLFGRREIVFPTVE